MQDKQSFIQMISGLLLELKKQLQEIIEKSRNLEKTNLELGLFHFRNGNYMDAAFRFKFVLWLNNKNKSANYLLGKTYIYAKKFSKAVKPLRLALKQNPKDEEAKFLLALCGEKVAVQKIPASFIDEQLELIAPNYEKLVTEIHSKINEVAKNLLLKHLKKKTDLNVLILPARGGDAGEILLERAGKIIGVEPCLPLAGAARTRKLGEKPVFREVQTKTPDAFFKSCKNKFDVIISTFYLSFFGRVEDVLEDFSKPLKKMGLLLISFEKGEADYELSRENLGFLHSAEYIGKAARKSGYKIISEQEVGKYVIMLWEKK